MMNKSKIQMELPEDMKGAIIYYSKDGEAEKAINVDAEAKVVISNLETGSYQIRIPNTENITFMPVEVEIPMWSEEEKKMLYDISVVPKYSREVSVPQTGDDNYGMQYATLGLLSFIIVVAATCYGRLRSRRKRRK